MSSSLSQFHYHLSLVPNTFEFERENFDIKEIYDFYYAKVILLYHSLIMNI